MRSGRERLLPVEKGTLIAIALIALALRGVTWFRYRFDSDEPQHLHVAWGWTQGLVQYRDLFDNHAPLFHMASAPVLKLLGERADILLYMRALMVPLFVIVVGATYILARRFWSERVALWSATLLTLFPPFFLKSIEYRTDNLWNAVWAIALVVITGGRATPLRIFASGLILGVAACVSLKTSLLVITLGLSWLTMKFALRETLGARQLLVNAGSFAAGLAVPPAIVAVFFAAIGAWKNLVYCTVEFNTLAERTQPHVAADRIAWPILVGLILWFARRRTWPSGDEARSQLFLGLYAALFIATLTSFWLLISSRDFLPVMPLLAIFLAAAALKVASTPARATALLTLIAAVFLAALAYYTDGFRDGTTEETSMVNQVLHLTRPGEPLMDYKGETIYRRRPYYFIFELITRSAMQKGLLRDGAAESVIASRCHVVQADGDFWPARSRRFLNENFLNVGRLRASGQRIRVDGRFSIAIPGDYVVLTAAGQAAGLLDGSPYRGPRYLNEGPHTFVRAVPEPVACLWAPAYQRGFSPFHLRDIEF